ncbi:hypothetical protein ACAG39_00470 [Caldicellulosiruptoraceae bacterium PP1]
MGASKEQMRAVAKLCPEFNSGGYAHRGNPSCEVCVHWDGKKCTINYFDNVLTSMDQT